MQNGGLSDWRDGLNGNPMASWRAAVTFVDNHDTGYSPGLYAGQHHWALARSVATRHMPTSSAAPGTPTVYWPDMYAWPRGALIRELIRQRLRAGIRADSTVSFSPWDDGRLVSLRRGQGQFAAGAG
jgi:alpha-amylase